MVVHNISHIAPVASNPTFLDAGRFPNLIRLGPDSNFQLQVCFFPFWLGVVEKCVCVFDWFSDRCHVLTKSRSSRTDSKS